MNSKVASELQVVANEDLGVFCETHINPAHGEGRNCGGGRGVGRGTDCGASRDAARGAAGRGAGRGVGRNGCKDDCESEQKNRYSPEGGGNREAGHPVILGASRAVGRETVVVSQAKSDLTVLQLQWIPTKAIAVKI
ncbi:unnamed protein product [Phytophthora fragariaefolia]|uniref:Unnamed protein product n=1 Tax=Phytophthora fragariaefolia TaxID=1490495 RepID=A0A9W6XAP4_9STRA|nr:unnamed protein product [Phytophthora fragariaefolia]